MDESFWADHNVHRCPMCEHWCMCENDFHCRHRCRAPEMRQRYLVTFVKTVSLTIETELATVDDAVREAQWRMRFNGGYKLYSIKVSPAARGEE